MDEFTQEHLDTGDSSVYFAVPATILFSETGTSCLIGFNSLGMKARFKFDGDRFISPEGFAIHWPDPHEGERAVKMYRQSPESVLLVEFGQDGYVDHTIN